MKKHIVVFSHGFGVRKDDRGLFPGIISGLKGVETLMFDYNEIDEVKHTITVLPLSKQAEILTTVLSDIKKSYPEAIIDLICHSQGCVVAALAKPSFVRKTLFLAPLSVFNFDRIIESFKNRPGTEIRMDGVSRLSRLDGSTTLVPAEYWNEPEALHNPIELYNELAHHTELSIIKALDDEVLGSADFSTLSREIQVMEIHGNHGFTGEARKELLRLIKKCIL